MQVRLPMSNAEELVAKAHEWIDQVGHELGWDENRTKSRKGEYGAKPVSLPSAFPGDYSYFVSKLMGLPLSAKYIRACCLLPTRQPVTVKCVASLCNREKCQ